MEETRVFYIVTQLRRDCVGDRSRFDTLEGAKQHADSILQSQRTKHYHNPDYFYIMKAVARVEIEKVPTKTIILEEGV